MMRLDREHAEAEHQDHKRHAAHGEGQVGGASRRLAVFRLAFGDVDALGDAGFHGIEPDHVGKVLGPHELEGRHQPILFASLAVRIEHALKVEDDGLPLRADRPPQRQDGEGKKDAEAEGEAQDQEIEHREFSAASGFGPASVARGREVRRRSRPALCAASQRRRMGAAAVAARGPAASGARCRRFRRAAWQGMLETERAGGARWTGKPSSC